MEDNRQQLTAEELKEWKAAIAASKEFERAYDRTRNYTTSEMEPLFAHFGALEKYQDKLLAAAECASNLPIIIEKLCIERAFQERCRAELQRCYDLVCPNDGSEPHRVTFQKLNLSGAVADSVHARLLNLHQENERLRAHIDALTEYLRHGPNCPADVANLTSSPGKCDCGLRELLANENQDAALCRDAATTNDLPTPTPPPPTQPAT